MQTMRDFELNGSRYVYDFGSCTPAQGWAQLDTSQDASYYGIWANPFRKMVFSYCEGDKTLQIAETEEEFTKEIQNIKLWNDNSGYRFLGIDPGFNVELKAKFEELGLKELLH